MEKPFAITLDVGSSLANKTGSWRTERPGVRRPRCRRAATPARPARTSRGGSTTPRRATTRAPGAQIMEDNPLPAVMGRVCYHPCETACNRGQLDEAVGINSVERFLGDEAIKRGLDRSTRRAERSGKRVLVVGAGPSGLSAAYHLTRLGHARRRSTTPGPAPGGMMRFGIPRYRLPRDVLDAEIAADPGHGRGAALGQHGRRTCGRRCARAASTPRSSRSARTSASAPTSPPAAPPGSSTRSRCCAAWRGRRRRCSAGAWSVYGGGDTAIDAARTARRLGADDAVVVYRRTRDRMPAHDFEVEEALEEGVSMRWLSTIKHADAGKLHDRADGARRERLPAAHRRVRGARGRLAGARARSGDRPRRCSTACRASRWRTGW